MKSFMSSILGLAFVAFALVTVQPLAADDVTVNIESVVVQDFDDFAAQPWFVMGSKFSTEGFPKAAYVNSWPLAVFGSNPANKDSLNALGVAMLFDRREYNWVDLVPGKKSGSGESATYEPVELPLPGRVSAIDLWIWSPNFSYYIEAYIRDYKGIVHVIDMGELSHVGWKNFRINIPSSIPQSKKYLPRRESLSLVKFRIWTRPTEVAATPAPAGSPAHEKAVYFYFDQLKVLTDTFESLYDGDQLTDQDFVEKTWGSGE